MKTIKEWLMELPEPVRSRALKYELKPISYWDDKVKDIHTAVRSAFNWDKTEEDLYYWVRVSDGEYAEAEALLTPDTRKQNSMQNPQSRRHDQR
jgi:hypothetical protein